MTWPSGVPNSLWNYNRSVAGSSSDKILPLSNYSISGEFILYFLIGLVVVWLYAWNRFNRRTYDPAPFDYRVLRELQPSQMRDSLLMQRAFMLYGLVLSLIYTSFTFFSGLILRITDNLPVVGPVDVDPQTLQSPQWPLMLAFGLAGLTQLIGPLDHLEKTLRSHIHKSLGIPIRIKEYTRLLISRQLVGIREEAIEHLTTAAGATPTTGPVEASIDVISKGRITHPRRWARDEIAQTFGVEDVLARLVLLWRMIDSLYSPDWPQESVRDEMRPLLSRELPEARAIARHLSDLLESAHAHEIDLRQMPSDDAQEGASTSVRTRQEQQLVTAIESMERHLYEIGAIHAVYAQRDRNYDSIPERNLRTAIIALFDEENYGPSLAQLACCAAVVFAGYFSALTLTSQGLMTAMPRNVWTVGLSAGYETLRTLCIYVFPLLFAIYVTTPDRSRPNAHPSTAGVAMAAFLWSGIASLLLMALLALLYTWLVAINTDHFNQMLLGRFNTEGSLPHLAWFISYSAVSALVGAGVTLARRVSSDRLHYAAMALVAFLAAVLSKLHELAVSQAASWCWSNPPECLARNFADMIFASVAVMFLCQGATVGRIVTDRRQATRRSRTVGAGAAMSMAVAFWIAGGAAVWAQAPDGQEGTPATPRQVNLGFRSDAEPFSYLNSSGGQPRFRGFIVDFCHEIFAGSGYRTVSVGINVEDRFERLRPGTDTAKQPLVDVLCDPVTVRFQDTDRWHNGIFSPVIFASSVIYLRRDSRAINPSEQFGFVRNTTAASVAREICRGSIAADKVASCDTDTHFDLCGDDPREIAAAPVPPPPTGFMSRFLARLLPPPIPENSRPTQVVCGHDTHEKLVEWFCKSSSRARRYYIGDRELVIGKWESWKARNGQCPAEINSTSYTYEPYALLVTKSDPELVQFVQRRVYQIFSDSSKARALFAASFPDTQMSIALAYLFLLNGVDEERAIHRPDCATSVPECPRGQVGDDPTR